ncbi:hypothetical protein CCICO_00665 [Corynebacterium ciconiae DSM 44920]|uniref:DUF2020 domain-containing protein n=1 Tax=Corynebacterium ciconiae TaxID=227319 RepID=UPI00038154F8|nr:DUF2020 domain-containing protein [Corynebacterium ciconiae]WKD60191.1 hypothetical protein CCICO_00665 [Corynebacterium ciconiae DSM 44920]
MTFRHPSRLPLILGTALALGLAGCSDSSTASLGFGGADEGSEEASISDAQPGLPVDTLPEVARGANEVCPYLDTQFVANTNGQRVIDQGVDTRFDPPACVFWSYGDNPQVMVSVRYNEDEAIARQVVDWAAPVGSTEPADQPAGFQGGRGSLDESGLPGYSVYAVAKGATSVVVFSDQEQTIKPESIAEEVISNLGL